MDNKFYNKMNVIVNGESKGNIKKFREFAALVVDNECTVNGLPLVGDHRKTVVECTAFDMAYGAHLMKNKYLLIGAGIGFGTAVVSYISYKTVKKVKREKKS